jgi:hypothetical protein
LGHFVAFLKPLRAYRRVSAGIDAKRFGIDSGIACSADPGIAVGSKLQPKFFENKTRAGSC